MGCQCSVADSDRISWTGAGSAGDPFVADIIVSPQTRNQLSNEADGALVRTYPWCKIALSTNSNRTNGQNLLWDVEIADLYGMFDAGVDNRIITIPENGWYVIHSRIIVQANASLTGISFEVDDFSLNTIALKSQPNQAGWPDPVLEVYEEVPLHAGQSVQCIVNFTGVASVTVLGGFPPHYYPATFTVAKREDGTGIPGL